MSVLYLMFNDGLPAGGILAVASAVAFVLFLLMLAATVRAGAASAARKARRYEWAEPVGLIRAVKRCWCKWRAASR
jgi:hypothetical protein